MGKMSEAYPHLVLDNFSTQVYTLFHSCYFALIMVSSSLCVLEKLTSISDQLFFCESFQSNLITSK